MFNGNWKSVYCSKEISLLQEEKWENQFTIGMGADFKGSLAGDVAEQKEISLPQEEKKMQKKRFYGR